MADTQTSPDTAMLKAEFDQQFSQLRHYDSQVLGVARFGLTAVFTLLASLIGIYQYHYSKVEEKLHRYEQAAEESEIEYWEDEVDSAAGGMARDLFSLGLLGTSVGLVSLVLIVADRINYLDACRNIASTRQKMYVPGSTDHIVGIVGDSPKHRRYLNTHVALACLFGFIATSFLGFSAHHISYYWIRDPDYMILSWYNVSFGVAVAALFGASLLYMAHQFLRTHDGIDASD
jgi:hypothetical protein